jgi:O-antigen/teichoic acid export membrane protein
MRFRTSCGRRAGCCSASHTAVLAVVGAVIAPSIVDALLHVPASHRDEAIGVVRLLSLSLPPLAHGVVLRGVLEAAQRFRRVNALRVPLGIASYAGPLIAIPLGADARIAVGVIVIARIAYWLAHFPVMAAVATGLARPRLPTRSAVTELAHVGGWITVSNVVSPIIVQADRAVIAMGFPIAASGWYGAAAEVATKQWLLTAAVLPVVFSALSAMIATARDKAVELMERTSRLILLVLLPAVVILVAFAEPGLRLWLGNAYVPEAASALRWIAVAVYVNALAQVAYAILQGGVDSRSPAILHLIELPLYIALLIGLTKTLGVRGVAIGWFVRMFVDTIALWSITYRRMPEARASIVRIARLATMCSVIVAFAAAITR